MMCGHVCQDGHIYWLGNSPFALTCAQGVCIPVVLALQLAAWVCSRHPPPVRALPVQTSAVVKLAVAQK